MWGALLGSGLTLFPPTLCLTPPHSYPHLGTMTINFLFLIPSIWSVDLACKPHHSRQLFPPIPAMTLRFLLAPSCQCHSSNCNLGLHDDLPVVLYHHGTPGDQNGWCVVIILNMFKVKIFWLFSCLSPSVSPLPVTSLPLLQVYRKSKDVENNW